MEEDINELFFSIVLTGHLVKKKTLIKLLTLLYDVTFEEDYSVTEVNGNTIFTNKCLPFFVLARKESDNNEDIVSIDLFIDEYKRLLLKDEQYNLISILNL